MEREMKGSDGTEMGRNKEGQKEKTSQRSMKGRVREMGPMGTGGVAR